VTIPDSLRDLRRSVELRQSAADRLEEVCEAVGADAVFQITRWDCDTRPQRSEGPRSIQGTLRLHYALYSKSARQVVAEDSLYEIVTSNMYKPGVNLLALAAGDTASQQYSSEGEMYVGAASRAVQDLTKDLVKRIDELIPAGGRVLALNGDKEVDIDLGTAVGGRKGMKLRAWAIAEAGSEPDNIWWTPSTDPLAEMEIIRVSQDSATAKVKKIQKGRTIAIGDIVRFKTRKS
jgi:hypothetical protein